MTDLTSLIERLEKAEGPSRELDRAIWEAFGSPSRSDGVPEFAGFLGIAMFSSSIDAAVSLAERVLPGWFFEHIGNDAMGEDDYMSWLGWTVELSPGMSAGAQGQAKTLPIAIVIATLRALQSKGEA